MATLVDGYPLYFDGTNEKGLSMAGLNFPENADYKPEASGKTNITPFEFIPWMPRMAPANTTAWCLLRLMAANFLRAFLNQTASFIPCATAHRGHLWAKKGERR